MQQSTRNVDRRMIAALKDHSRMLVASPYEKNSKSCRRNVECCVYSKNRFDFGDGPAHVYGYRVTAALTAVLALSVLVSIL